MGMKTSEVNLISLLLMKDHVKDCRMLKQTRVFDAFFSSSLTKGEIHFPKTKDLQPLCDQCDSDRQSNYRTFHLVGADGY